MSFAVKWGRHRLHFPLPPPDTKLAVIRHAIADYTHLPEHSFKIIHAGAVMKDDNAPMSAYSIRENSILVIIEAPLQPPTGPAQPTARTAHISAKATHHEPKTEQGTITQIKSEVDKVRQTLLPSVDTFLHAIIPSTYSPADQNSTAYPQTQTQQAPPHLLGNSSPEQEHTRLSELLLQSLLRLDAITTDGSWEHARAERKVAVKEVQGLLDRLDGGWGQREKV